MGSHQSFHCTINFFFERRGPLPLRRMDGFGMPRLERTGEVVRFGERCRGERRVGEQCMSRLSSNFLVSCFSKIGSSEGSRVTFDRELSKMLRMFSISFPVRALREMYCCLCLISWDSWSLRVASWNDKEMLWITELRVLQNVN